ncbi:hypothetical protein ES708_15739 [subsurface metagenome]
MIKINLELIRPNRLNPVQSQMIQEYHFFNEVIFSLIDYFRSEK